jgi:DNA-binding GntR family transcriptional regulator
VIESIKSRLAANRSTGPKYQVLCTAIIDVISKGDWKPGMRLPTELELAETLPFSLGTVQKAYGELVRNGLVERSRGRGSFVAPMRRQMADPWYCRFLDHKGALLPVYPRILGHRPVRKDVRLTQLFGKTTKLVRIDRINSINDEFDVLSRFFCSRAVAKSLVRLSTEKVQTANFKLILLRELGVPIARVAQTVTKADSRVWRTLPLRAPPYLTVEGTAYADDDVALFFQELYIPENNRRLLFESELKF